MFWFVRLSTSSQNRRIAQWLERSPRSR